MNLQPPPDDKDKLKDWCDELYRFLQYPVFERMRMNPIGSCSDTSEGNIYYDSDDDNLKLRGASSWLNIPQGDTAKIIKGNTSVEVVDAGDGYIVFTEDGSEVGRFTGGNFGVGITPTAKIHAYTAAGTDILSESSDGAAYPKFTLKHADQEWNMYLNGANDGLAWKDVTNTKYPFTIQANTPTNSLYVASTGNIHFGGNNPNEKLTVEGNLSLKEGSAPSHTANYGKFYVKSSDSLPYFKNDGGTEFGLTGQGNDILSIVDYGAVGDGSTNNDSVFNTIQADSEAWFYVPEGTSTYNLTNGYTFTKRYDGPGVIKIGTHKQANFNGQITSARTAGDKSNPDGHFDGDMSQILRAEKFKLSVGANNPVPDPGAGNYTYWYETSPHFASFEIGAGVGAQQYDAAGGGRTGITWNRVMLRHKGFGDAACWNAYVETGDPAYDYSNDTNMGHSAGVIINGNVKGMQDYAYLNPLEWVLEDSGTKSVSAAGLVCNYHRDNDNEPNAGVKNWWFGTRHQNKKDKYCNSTYVVGGKWKVGLDLVPATLHPTNSPAITMKTGNRIWFNSTGDSWETTSCGSAYIRHNNSVSALQFAPKIYSEGSIHIKEQASADGDTVAYGQLWIKNTTPNQLWFTDDAGTDSQVGGTDPQYIRSNANDIVTGNTTWNDNYQARFGTGSDMKIYHTGANGIIYNTVGYISIKPTVGAVWLHYGNSKKAETVSAGFNVTGSLAVTVDINATGNIYATGTVSAGGACCPDYIFEPDYNLMSLDELQEFIKEERHLPDMTINNTDRIDLAISVEELLIKTEEQALYILQLHERLETLEVCLN